MIDRQLLQYFDFFRSPGANVGRDLSGLWPPIQGLQDIIKVKIPNCEFSGEPKAAIACNCKRG